MTHCSQETGSALADVLFGDYNPAGRLVQTWPKSDPSAAANDGLRYNKRQNVYVYERRSPL